MHPYRMPPEEPENGSVSYMNPFYVPLGCLFGHIALLVGLAYVVASLLAR